MSDCKRRFELDVRRGGWPFLPHIDSSEWSVGVRLEFCSLAAVEHSDLGPVD